MPESVTNDSLLADFVFAGSSDGILLAGIDGSLKRINPAGAAMLGLTIEEAIGHQPRITFRQNMALVNLFEREGEQRLDVRLPRRRLAQGIATTLASGERLVLLQDVTEKRDLENRREALTKTIAHDLRNPIAAIGGFIDLVLKVGDPNEQQRRFLSRARQTSSKLHDMISTLVDLAWIEAGMPLQHLPMDLEVRIRQAVKTVEPIAQKQRVGITTSLQRPLPTIAGDPERLHLAIYHLLHNAVVYSLLDEKNIAVHAWGDEQEVYCTVADRGIGIADNELDLIFDRMYRSRDERVSDVPGGGLGLTIARTIIQRHGGDIWAASNLEHGSTFTFVLPAAGR